MENNSAKKTLEQVDTTKIIRWNNIISLRIYAEISSVFEKYQMYEINVFVLNDEAYNTVASRIDIFFRIRSTANIKNILILMILITTRWESRVNSGLMPEDNLALALK